jgi:hypothetical protein
MQTSNSRTRFRKHARLILPSAPARIRPLSAVSPFFAVLKFQYTWPRLCSGRALHRSKSRRAIPPPDDPVGAPIRGRLSVDLAIAESPSSRDSARAHCPQGTAAGEDAIPLGLSIPQHAGPRSRDRSSPWAPPHPQNRVIPEENLHIFLHIRF